jgi:hypothetical protein
VKLRPVPEKKVTFREPATAIRALKRLLLFQMRQLMDFQIAESAKRVRTGTASITLSLVEVGWCLARSNSVVFGANISIMQLLTECKRRTCFSVLILGYTGFGGRRFVQANRFHRPIMYVRGSDRISSLRRRQTHGGIATVAFCRGSFFPTTFSSLSFWRQFAGALICIQCRKTARLAREKLQPSFDTPILEIRRWLKTQRLPMAAIHAV